MSGSTISSGLYGGITLGIGGYTSPLTITSTGGITGASVITGEGPGPRPSVTSYGKVALESIIANPFIVNQGTITGGYGTDIGGGGVFLNSGTLINQGVIRGNSGGSGGGAGVEITGSLQNTGAIYGGHGKEGVSLSGALTNEGLIEGGAGFVSQTSAGSFNVAAGAGLDLFGTGTNAGTIIGGNGGAALGQGGNGLALRGGAFTNNGIILGGAYGTPFQGSAGASVSNSLLINNGTIMSEAARYNGAGGNDGVGLTAGTVINNGTIICNDGGSALEISQGTLVNTGTIVGAVIGDVSMITNDAGGSIGGSVTLIDGGALVDAGIISGAVQLSAFSSFALDPGAIFTGPVAGAGGNSLELGLGNGAAGTLDMGGSFSGFSTIAFDPGAVWTLGGTAAELADGETITGFTPNDTLILNGFAATSDTYVAGTGLELSNGVIIETVDITGNFGALTFAISSQSGETTIALTDPPHTISNTVTTTVTLGSVYLSPLTITATGAIAPTAARATGLYAASGTVTNQGVITGGADSGVAGATNIGGIGVSLIGATLFNAGTITGGADLYASGNHESPTHAGGIGLSLAGGTVTNSGAISGGVGGSVEGVGGFAAVLTGGALTNTGTITGGVGAAGAGGGTGVSLTNASLRNAGIIAGGNASTLQSLFGGIGGNGVALYANATLSNTGTITGGAIETAEDGGGGGAGIFVDGGEATSSGTVTGGGGYVLGGAGAQVLAGSLTNTGGITGAFGSHLSGGGVVMTGGTFTNGASGTITGGIGKYLSGGSGAGAFLSGGTATNDGTILGGDSADDPGTGGAGGAGVYLNGGAFTNNARIAGGNALPVNGGAIYAGGGPGALIDSGLLTNTGTITGGNGTIGGLGASTTAGTLHNLGLIIGGAGDVAGGIGLVMSGGTVTDAGTILGQAGVSASPAATGAAGGSGVVLNGGYLSVSQYGSIIGGNGGYGVMAGGAGGFGAYLTGGSLVNHGFIGGGTDGLQSGGTADAGAFGIGINGGALSNFGSITGGTAHGGIFSSVGAAAVVLKSGGVYNAGVITGGYGGFVGGAGAVIYGGSFVNAGTLGSGHSGFGGGHGGAIVSGGLLVNDITGVIQGPDSGVSLTSGSVQNAGMISGGTYSDAVAITGGILTNLSTGTISGGSHGAGIYVSGGTLITGGAIIGGVAAVTFNAPALLIVDPGASFVGDVLGLGTLEVAGSSATALSGLGTSITGFSTIDFATGAAWTIDGDAAGLGAGQTIFGFAAGDTLNLDGFTATSDTFAPGTGLELFDGSLTETIDLIGNFSTDSFIVLDQARGTEIQLCYLRGTRILTPVGEVPIETLSIGDAVITRFNGYRRIKWIGRQSFGRRFIETNRAQRPIRIAAGALGPHLPKRDLYVSPGHSMLISNVLVLASNLINGITITQSDCPDDVHYYQVEFETHDCVQAEGCWSESFCDYADLRNQFHNVADFHSLFPNHITPAEHLMCAPRPEHGLMLDAALRPIVARAVALVPPGPLQGWIDHVHPSGIITGWAQDIAHPELPVLLEILLRGRPLGTILACDPRADLAAAGIGQGRAAFAYKGSAKIPRVALPSLQIRRAVDCALLPLASHCVAALSPVSQSRRKRA